MTDKIIISRKEIDKLLTQLNITHQDIRALLEKAEVSEPVASYYGILDTGTVIDVNDTYDEANNKLQSLIKYAIDYKSAIIIPLYTSPQPSRIAEREAEIARLKAIIDEYKKDAERYRWIKSQTSEIHVMFDKYDLGNATADLMTAKVGKYLDEAIDLAMKSTKDK